MREKAIELVEKFDGITDCNFGLRQQKQCAIISVKNEYNSNRELLFNLKSSGVEMSEKVYLTRLQNLIDEEELLIIQIDNL